jgi:hypothetical protein
MTSGDPSSQSKALDMYRGYLPAHELPSALKPVLDRFSIYDRLRIKLEEQETDPQFWKMMTEFLSNKIVLRTGGQRYEFALTEPGEMKKALMAIHYDLHLEVRQRGTLLPVYYLCRTKWDYWSEYGLIVEDLYASPGYPFHDQRLVKLMQFSHEAYYLRLSQMRARATAIVEGSESLSPDSECTDKLLYDVGRYVFQAIWHEDQKPALAACAAFDLRRFRLAMESLYMCLSGDLCYLRGVMSEQFYRFFTSVYPQPALVALLRSIQEADGATLASLPQRVRPLYFCLSRAFGTFLKKEIHWKSGLHPLPLYKVLFANMSRLEILHENLKDNPEVKEAAETLNLESDAIIEKILGRNG